MSAPPKYCISYENYLDTIQKIFRDHSIFTARNYAKMIFKFME